MTYIPYNPLTSSHATVTWFDDLAFVVTDVTTEEDTPDFIVGLYDDLGKEPIAEAPAEGGTDDGFVIRGVYIKIEGWEWAGVRPAPPLIRVIVGPIDAASYDGGVTWETLAV